MEHGKTNRPGSSAFVSLLSGLNFGSSFKDQIPFLHLGSSSSYEYGVFWRIRDEWRGIGSSCSSVEMALHYPLGLSSGLPGRMHVFLLTAYAVWETYMSIFFIWAESRYKFIIPWYWCHELIFAGWQAVVASFAQVYYLEKQVMDLQWARIVPGY